MARKVGKIMARGDRRWLIGLYLGRDHETSKRKYHNQTIYGPMRKRRSISTRKLRKRDLSRWYEENTERTHSTATPAWIAPI